MKLHFEKQVFSDAIRTTAQDMGIATEFVEKDYWICQILQKMSRHPKAGLMVWKGGTSLSKAYGIIKRFSSDVDFAVLTDGLSQNQQKRLLIHIDKDTTSDLNEIVIPGQTIKNNRFRKTYHAYESVISQPDSRLGFLGNHVVVEINTYGNPYPYEQRNVKPFITEMMERRGVTGMVEEMDMQPFVVNVLDKRQTLCEKVVSLLRFSFEEDPIQGLASKIRHFYDLYFLMQDDACQDYLRNNFSTDLLALLKHDKEAFDSPPLWRNSDIRTSVLLTDMHDTWEKLAPVYLSELGALTYGETPNEHEIAISILALLRKVDTIIGESGLNN